MMGEQTEEASVTDRLLQDVVAAYRADKFVEVETSCQRILKQHPDHVASLQILAAVAGQSGAPQRGIELLEKVIALEPRRAEGYIQLAKLLRLDDRDPEAIAALGRAIELEPHNASAYNDLGLIHLHQNDLVKGLQCFNRAIECNPAFVIAQYNKALTLERQGLYGEAIAAFRQVVAIDGNFVEAHAKFGNLLLFVGDRVEGLLALQKAADKTDSVVGLMCQAKLLMEDENPTTAEEVIRRAVQRDPHNSDAHCLLGSILMELGRFHDAAVAFDLGLALNRQQIAAHHELVHVKKLSEPDRPLLAQMEWMLREKDLADAERADLHLALGKAYDDLREYSNAIQHFDEGNRLKRPIAGHYVATAHAAVVERIITMFTAEFFGRNTRLGSDWDVPVFIVGMPRSGTTLVEQILSSHPDIAAGGELAFWGERAPGFSMSGDGRISPTWAVKVASEYRSLLGGISATAWRVTDKRPQNFEFIPLIHSVFPHARIIHCRRHPVDTCLSIYFQNFSRRIEFAYDRGDLLAYYRQYQRLMAHWRSTLPVDRLLEIPYEELVADRETWTRRMIEFCGLEWDDACLQPERNPRSVRTASVWQARQPVYKTSVARWRHYEPWLGPLQELLVSADRPEFG